MAYFQRIKWIVSLFFLLLSYYVKAQNNETSFIHLDRPFYVVGDEVWFKIYLLGNEVVSSTIIHAELVSPEGKTLLHQNLKVTNKMALGNFKIPLEWQEGHYLFRTYTLWQNDSLNTSKAVISKLILPIYNDFTDVKPLPVKAVSSTENIEIPAVMGDFTVSCDEKRVFKRNEKITLTLSIKDAQNKPIEADLSVSIFEYIPLIKNDLWAHFQETQAKMSDKSFENQTLKTEKELTLEGKILDSKNQNLITDNYLSLYLPQSKQFKRITAKDGFFKTTLPFFEAQTDIQMLCLNPNRSYPLEIEPVEKPLYLPNYKAEKIPERLPEIDKYLQLNRFRRQTVDIFNFSSSNTALKDSFKNILLYEPDNSYDTKNFTNITTFEDFVKEVMYTSIIIKKDDKKTMRLQNADVKKIYNFAPWYLVDGLFADDEEQVLNIPINDISHIDIFNKKKTIEKYFDPLMFRYGIVSVTTKKSQSVLTLIKPKKSVIQGFTPLQDWQETLVIDDKFPNFQPMLTWQPSLKTSRNGSTSVSFKAGDIKGKFAVRVVGKTSDEKPVSGIFIIEIN